VRNTAIVLGLVVLVGCTSMTPTNDPVYLRIQDLEARLIRIERVLENESLIELAGDIRALRAEVQTLLGDVETVQYELDNQADRQRDLSIALDERLSELEAAQSRMSSMPAVPVTPTGVPVAAVTDQQAYDAAFARIQQQDFAGAQMAFVNFLATYPASALRGNAQYWLAETYYADLDYRTALVEFQRVLDNYPQSSKMPDALLKIGYCNDSLGNTTAARQALLRVVREFPDTSAANLADQRLARLAQ